MPNWMTVTMVAETNKKPMFEIKRDFSAFDAVKPMPKVLSRTISGSESSIVQEHYDKGLGWILANCTSSPNTSQVLALARCYRAKQETGYADWYDWRYMNWGVKWDIAEHSVFYDESDNRITFEVPWSFPEQGITALSEKYPNVTFLGEFAEEQAGYFSGTFEATAGNLTIHYDDEFSDEAYERYFALCGGEECYQHINGQYVYIDD